MLLLFCFRRANIVSNLRPVHTIPPWCLALQLMRYPYESWLLIAGLHPTSITKSLVLYIESLLSSCLKWSELLPLAALTMINQLASKVPQINPVYQGLPRAKHGRTMYYQASWYFAERILGEGEKCSWKKAGGFSYYETRFVKQGRPFGLLMLFYYYLFFTKFPSSPTTGYADKLVEVVAQQHSKDHALSISRFKSWNSIGGIQILFPVCPQSLPASCFSA